MRTTTLTVKIDGEEYTFTNASLKEITKEASVKLTSEYPNRPVVVDAIKRWKKNQFFFRMPQLTSEICR